MGLLFCWLILVVFSSALTPAFDVSSLEDAHYSIVASLTIAITLSVLSLAEKRLEPYLSRYGASVGSGLFIITNGLLLLNLLSQEVVPLRANLIIAAASVAAALMMLLFFRALLSCTQKELAIIIPCTLFGAIVCSVLAGILQEQAYGALLCCSSLASVCLLLYSKGPTAKVKNGATRKTQGTDSGFQSISAQGKALFILSASIIVLSFFAVHGYNKTVALFVRATEPVSYALAIVFGILTTVALVLIQRRLTHPLLFCPLLGLAIAINGILIMIVEPFGMVMFPIVSAIDLPIFIIVLTGIINLSLRIAKFRVFPQTAALVGLFVPLLLGLALGTVFAYENSLRYETLPFVRIVLLCVLFCPYALLVSSVHEKENHFFFADSSRYNDAPALIRDKFPGPIKSAEGIEDPTQEAVSGLAEMFALTFRETEILEYLLTGRDVVFISNELFISKNTVATHIKHIYQKLDIHSKQELITFAKKLGSSKR